MDYSKKCYRFVFCGGGTGGHLYPALSIADSLKKAYSESDFLFLGKRNNIEERLIPKKGYRIQFINAEPFPSGKNLWKFLRMSFLNMLGFLKAIWILLLVRPHIVISMGGYVSAPTVFAWYVLKKFSLIKCPCFVHEQNVIPGKMNRLAGSLVDCVGISFEQSAEYFPLGKVTIVGYPVRSEITGLRKEESRKNLGIDKRNKVILAFGGSQGARSINRAVVETLSCLKGTENVTLIHAIGQSKQGWEYNPESDTIRCMTEFGLNKDEIPWYRQIVYIDDIAEYYAASDLVICRGGAGTLSEIMACGLPSIIIPKAGLAEDHQVHNAMVLNRHGAAVVLFEHPTIYNGRRIFEVKERELPDAVSILLRNADKRRDMGRKAQNIALKDSNDRILRQIQALLDGKGILFPPQFRNNNKDGDLTRMPLNRLASTLKSKGKSRFSEISDADFRYIQYKVDLAINSNNFLLLSRGIRVAGLIEYLDKIPFLMELMEKRRPVSFWRRIIGGDLIPFGFVRRDIMEALNGFGVWNESVCRLLELGLEDPYFETRSAAARAISALGSKIDDPENLEKMLRRCLQDANVEVVWDSLRALGKISRDARCMEVIGEFCFNPSWKIRKAAVEAMTDLLRRRVVIHAQVAFYLESFLSTCNDFKPNFPLKQSLKELSFFINSIKN